MWSWETTPDYNNPNIIKHDEKDIEQKPQAETVLSTEKSLWKIMSKSWFDNFLKKQWIPEVWKCIIEWYIRDKNPIMPSLLRSVKKENWGKEVFFNDEIMPQIIDYYAKEIQTQPWTKLTEYRVSKMLEWNNAQKYIPIIIDELKYRISKWTTNDDYYYKSQSSEYNETLTTKLFNSCINHQPSIIVSEFSLFSTIYRPEYMIDILKSEITELDQQEINQLFWIINKRIESKEEQSKIFNDIFHEILESNSKAENFIKDHNEANSNEFQKWLYKITQANEQKYKQAINNLVKSLNNCNSKLDRNTFLELIKLNYWKKIIKFIDKFEWLEDDDYTKLYLSYYNDIHNCNPLESDINGIFDKMQELWYEDINLLVLVMKHTSLWKEKKLPITNLILRKINKGYWDYCEILNNHYKWYFDTIVIGDEKTHLVNYLVKEKGFTNQCNIWNMLKDLDIKSLNPEEIKELRNSFY